MGDKVKRKATKPADVRRVAQSAATNLMTGGSIKGGKLHNRPKGGKGK